MFPTLDELVKKYDGRAQRLKRFGNILLASSLFVGGFDLAVELASSGKVSQPDPLYWVFLVAVGIGGGLSRLAARSNYRIADRYEEQGSQRQYYMPT